MNIVIASFAAQSGSEQNLTLKPGLPRFARNDAVGNGYS